jgi:hypothetical protein
MSTRNFDNITIIQRLQNKVYASNLHSNNINGTRLIKNPQNSDGNSSVYNSYIPGSQTEYIKGLLGGKTTINIGGTCNT